LTEPRAVAAEIQEIAPGIWHWRIEDERIGGHTSASHAVPAVTVDASTAATPTADAAAAASAATAPPAAGTVLIDPLPLSDDALERLLPVEAICLTAQCHQRSAWRYRQRFGARVHAPHTRAMDEEPDVRYSEGELLPGALRAIHTPGPEDAHFSFLLEREPGVLFCSDLLMHDDGRLEFVPLEYHDDPSTTRRSVERLLELDFELLCLDHGAPILEAPKDAIRDLLARTAD
jgi:glyoxylase-like metal-dependent hydrolase (beta-lactamase superfamily II)